MQRFPFPTFWLAVCLLASGCGGDSSRKAVPQEDLDASPEASFVRESGPTGSSDVSVPTDATPDSATDAGTAPDARVRFALAVTHSGDGDGTVTADTGALVCPGACSEEYAPGTTVTLTAVPAASSNFVGWTGECTGSTTTCTVTVDAAAFVNAEFALASFDVTLSASGPGGVMITSDSGPVSCNGGTCSVKYGTKVNFQAISEVGAHFVGWNGNGCVGTSATCSLVVEGPHSVQGVFATDDFGVTVTKNGTGTGTVTADSGGLVCGATCVATYAYGTSVVLTAVEAVNSTFGGWTGCDTVVGKTCAVRVTGARAPVATFNLLTHVLTAALGGTGAGTVASAPAGIACAGDCTEAFVHGTPVVLTATASTGSTFGSWTSCPTPTANQCSVTVNAASTITANFTLNQYLLTVVKTGTGTVTSAPAGITCGATCASAFNYGAIVTLTATPGPLQKFGGFVNCPVAAANVCTVSVTAGRSVTANFVPDSPPTVTITTPADGTNFGSTTFDPLNGLYYQNITFTGTATDPEDGTLSGASLTWTTDQTSVQAGTLGTGASITVRVYAACSSSDHLITLTAKDKAGNVKTASITIHVFSGC